MCVPVFKMLCSVFKSNCSFKWLLLVWVLFGVLINIFDAHYFSSTYNGPFGIPPFWIYFFSIVNELILSFSIVNDHHLLLIIAVLLQCVFLVAVPVLIVQVVPSLLTYTFLLSTIILSILFSVLCTNTTNNIDMEDSISKLNKFTTDVYPSTSRRYSCKELSNCTNATRLTSDDGLVVVEMPSHSCFF